MRFVEYAAETPDRQSWRMLSGNEEARLTPGLVDYFCCWLLVWACSLC